MSAISVRLTRVKNGSALRTDDIVGITHALPKVGQGFSMIGKPLDPAATARVVNTSVVQSVGWLYFDTLVFTTLNSTYRLEILVEDPPVESP